MSEPQVKIEFTPAAVRRRVDRITADVRQFRYDLEMQRLAAGPKTEGKTRWRMLEYALICVESQLDYWLSVLANDA